MPAVVICHRFRGPSVNYGSLGGIGGNNTLGSGGGDSYGSSGGDSYGTQNTGIAGHTSTCFVVPIFINT